MALEELQKAADERYLLLLFEQKFNLNPIKPNQIIPNFQKSPGPVGDKRVVQCPTPPLITGTVRCCSAAEVQILISTGHNFNDHLFTTISIIFEVPLCRTLPRRIIKYKYFNN